MMTNTPQSQSQDLQRNMPESLNSEKLANWLTWIFLIAIILVASVFSLYFLNFNDRLSNENGDWGTFGDFIGGTLNPILSFMSLIALLLTVTLQSRQAEISKTELEDTRKELARSASAQEKTERIQATQTFETTLFNLIKLHHELVSGLRFNAVRFIKKLDSNTQIVFSKNKFLDNHSFEGRLVFDAIVEFIAHLNFTDPNHSVYRYMLFHEHNNNVLSLYFRNLNQILKLIKTTENNWISEKQKRVYASIVKSQLSDKELALVFLNHLDKISTSDESKNLIIEYEFFENLPIQSRNDIAPGAFYISDAFLISMDMVSEYVELKRTPEPDSSEQNIGAFGKNRGISI